jgi:DNA-binding transcriptional LysR family regulator
MALDMKDLTVFLAVAREGSFGRAATSLLVTQPAVSERLRHLERVVGVQVVERSSRGARLTAAGERLLPYAQRCVALADEGLDAARSADGVPRLVIAVHSTFAPRVVPQVLGALVRLPRRVSVRDAHSHEVQALVADGVADLGFSIPAATPKGLRRVTLPPDPVVCVAADGHLPRDRRALTPRSLSGSVLAINEWGEGAERFVAGLRRAGVDEWRMRFCADAATALALARDHDHLAFVARSSASALVESGELRTVSVSGVSQWRIELELLHRTNVRDHSAVQAVVEALGSSGARPRPRR